MGIGIRIGKRDEVEGKEMKYVDRKQSLSFMEWREREGGSL